jgi:ADP-heptose:LPS heptosyltransferase
MPEKLASRLVPGARILVVRLDSIGDCVLSAGFFIGLRALFPAAHITGVFQEETAPLYETSGLFDEILRASGGNGPELSPPYDLAICPRWDIDHWGALELIQRSGAPLLVGFERAGVEVFTHALRTPGARHEVLKNRDLLMFLGAPAEPPPPRLFIPDAAREAAWRLPCRLSLGRYAVLGISARSANRIWPIESFLPVVDALSARFGLRSIVIGGADAQANGHWLEDMRPDSVTSPAGQLDVMGSAALIAEARIFIGMDSGPMHLAAASGVPVVEISCHPLNGRDDHDNAPQRFGPFATPSRVLQPSRARLLCSDGCDQLDISHCITLVTPAEVIEAVGSLLDETL